MRCNQFEILNTLFHFYMSCVSCFVVCGCVCLILVVVVWQGIGVASKIFAGCDYLRRNRCVWLCCGAEVREADREVRDSFVWGGPRS